jgi:outer membrane immunogenic protein
MRSFGISRSLLVAAALLLTLSRPALAGDDAAAPASAASSDNRWEGFYIGAHGGHGSGDGDVRFDPLPTPTQFVNLLPQTLHADPSGGLFGVQLGYGWQLQNVIVGFEADYSHSNMDGSQTVAPIIQNNGTPFPGAGNYEQASQDISWLSTVRVRFGWAAMHNWIIYGTGGAAYGHVHYFAITSFPPAGTTRYSTDFSKNSSGWTGGLGTEFAFSKHWSVKVEYMKFDLGRATRTVDAVPLLPPYQVRYQFATSGRNLTAGVNYRF